MKPILCLTALLLAAACLRTANAQTPSDPLADTAAYSLYAGADTLDRDRYFPLGVLFPRDDHELISYGFDFTEQAVGPLLGPTGSNLLMGWYIRRDETLPPAPRADHLGLFVASWAWHLMPVDQKIGAYGPFPKTRSYFDPAVRSYLIAADTALAKTYGSAGRPAMMWSLDNEWEGGLDYTPAAQAGFQTWLRDTYKMLPALNAAWGTTYADWTAVVPPPSEPKITRPAAFLDWHAYQDGYFTRMTADRYRALYETDPLRRPVAYKSTQQSYDIPSVGKGRVLDPALLGDLTRPLGAWYGTDIYDADDSYIYQVNFAAQCIRPLDDTGKGNLFLTETNNHGGPGWQFANSIWRTLGNGAKACDLFCFGRTGATDDSDIYGLTAPSTLLRGKAPYAARFAYAVRRNEAFWARSKPADHVRRVAILLNRPDMLLDDDTPGNIWAGPKDSRSGVYAALRAAGYWVDVLPYTKLNARFMKRYDALFLINSDHLSADACSQISDYVKQGGVLVADALAGYFDTHHQVRRGLEPLLGVHVADASAVSNDAAIEFQTPEGVLHGSGSAPVTSASAALSLFKTASGVPVVLKSTNGKGTVLYVNAHLGELHGATDDVFGRWLAALLANARVLPSYSTTTTTETASLRVEQPYTADGNLALVVANLNEKPHAATRLQIQLPPGQWTHALWSPAENEDLTPVKLTHLGGNTYVFDIPPFATAGMLLLMPNHPPLIAIAPLQTAKHGVDGFLPALTPGKPAPVSVTVINPASTSCPAGRLTARALRGWRVEPAIIRTPAIPANGVFHVTVRVTPPETGVLPYAERMYPINLRWSDGKHDRAVTTTPVGVDISNEKCPWLLTENALYTADYPRKLKTGATYTYSLAPSAGTVADPGEGKGKPNSALQDGTSRWLMASESAHVRLSAGATTVPIAWDLKATYPLHAVRLLSSSFGGYPAKMDISLSTDGVHFTRAASAAPDGAPGSGKWLTADSLDGKSARYIRLNVALQNGEGYINEVEIWGYPAGQHSD